MWDLIPKEFLEPEIVKAEKGFIRIPYKKIKESEGGNEFINKIMEFLGPLTAVYSFPSDDVPTAVKGPKNSIILFINSLPRSIVFL